MKPDIVDRLSRCSSPTARYIRSRSDRIAVHQARERVVPFEVKTNPGSRHARLSIEALPLIHGIHTLMPTLYICRHIGAQWDAAFWTNHLPLFDSIWFSPRCTAYERWHVTQVFSAEKFWRFGTPDFLTSRVNGSGDAFVTIGRDAFEACLTDWRAEIARLAVTDERIDTTADTTDLPLDDRPRCQVCESPGCIAPHIRDIRWG